MMSFHLLLLLATFHTTNALITGESACENKGYDKTTCGKIGCCSYSDSENKCQSAVGASGCFAAETGEAACEGKGLDETTCNSKVNEAVRAVTSITSGVVVSAALASAPAVADTLRIDNALGKTCGTTGVFTVTATEEFPSTTGYTLDTSMTDVSDATLCVIKATRSVQCCSFNGETCALSKCIAAIEECSAAISGKTACEDKGYDETTCNYIGCCSYRKEDNKCLSAVNDKECKAPDGAGKCTGNTVTSEDVNCSDEATKKTNRGAAVVGNNAASCCVACLGSDATGCAGTDVCSEETANTCVAKGADDTTCAAIDADKPKWSTVSKECVATATGDATCAAIDAAKSKWRASSCIDGSTFDIELAKMCGEGTTFDKAKKKCVTDPTSRCTTNSASAEESAGSAYFVSRTATLTVIIVLCTLFYKLQIDIVQLD